MEYSSKYFYNERRVTKSIESYKTDIAEIHQHIVYSCNDKYDILVNEMVITKSSYSHNRRVELHGMYIKQDN